ncbi:MAG: thioredoxin family protein [Bacteroides sp.]|nr:thioredoxin family protein [Bacteroides sp.]
MKKLLSSLLLVLMVVPAVWAQTNFRSITYEQALEAAKAEKKLVFIDFYTTWCGPCKMMASKVFPQPLVGEYFNNKFVCLKLDAEKEGKALADRFQVKAYPTFVVVDTNEKVLLNKAGGNYDGAKFVAEIEAGINPELSPARLAERYAAGERTPELVEAYADLKMKEAREGRSLNQAKVDEALKLVNDYFNGLTDAQRLEKANTFVYAYSYAKSVLDPKVEYMVANRDRFAADAQETVAANIKKVHEYGLSNMLSGSIPYNGTEYQKIKQYMQNSGLNADKRFDIPFRLIETHAAGDLNAYLALCESDFKLMDESLKATVFQQFDALIQTEDKEILKRAIRFMRSQLPDLHTSTIYFGVMALMKLEKEAGTE